MASNWRPPLAVVFGIILALSGCGWYEKEVRVYSRGQTGFEPQILRSVFEEHSALQFVSAEVPPGMSCLDALATGIADLCREENSSAFVAGVRAVLPVHKSVLHVFLRDDFEPQEPERPLEGASIHIVENDSASQEVLRFLAKRQGLEPGAYTLVTASGEADIILHLGPIDPSGNAVNYPGYRMASMDDSLSPDLRATQEGLTYAVPNMEPVVIPALTYDAPGNEQPVHSLAVDTLLLTRKTLAEEVVYELVKTLLQQKPRLTAVSPAFFGGINEAFDPLELSFPLHRGARSYLEREEPGVLERYAETINMLVYVTVLLLSGLMGISRWRARRKKDRIDVFYLKVLAIRERAGDEDPDQLRRELLELEQQAFISLVAEKLAADESFRIFTDLISRVRVELSRGT
jgi:TRAP-type uncharacterized transport system substrate-binding protein